MADNTDEYDLSEHDAPETCSKKSCWKKKLSRKSIQFSWPTCRSDTESGTDKNESGKSKGKKSKSNLWIIIPSIIGGVILLIGLGILIYWCAKSKNSKKDEVGNNADTTDPIVDKDENSEDN